MTILVNPLLSGTRDYHSWACLMEKRYLLRKSIKLYLIGVSTLDEDKVLMSLLRKYTSKISESVHESHIVSNACLVSLILVVLPVDLMQVYPLAVQ